MAVQDSIRRVTDRIVERSAATRATYLERSRGAARQGPHRQVLGCGNLALGFAACPASVKADL